MVFLPVNNQDFINPLTLMSEQDRISPTIKIYHQADKEI